MRNSQRGKEESRSLPWYGWLGVIALLVGEAGLYLNLTAIRTLFYCIAWWSYILLADAWVWRRGGYSLLRSRPWEFWFLAFWSVPLWNLFEVLNFRLGNWCYVNVPTDSAMGLILGLSSYATVLPGLFETYELLKVYGVASGFAVRPRRVTPLLLVGSLAVGSGMLAAVLLWPGLAFPLVWGFAIFLGDPLCYSSRHTRTRSLFGQLQRGEASTFLRLLMAGLICGGLWEFWNFWAYTKWLYTVPFFQNVKWFEMPPLGFLGFPPFAVECYVLVNLLNTARRGRHWEVWDRIGGGAPRWLTLSAIVAALAFDGLVYAGIDAFTIKSVAPTLADMEGIPMDSLARLGRLGVTTPPAFLRRTGTADQLTVLAADSGIDRAELAAIRDAARLVDLKGLGAANYNALRQLGITRAEELAEQTPTLLFPRWREVVTMRPPTFALVRIWVRAARRFVHAETATFEAPRPVETSDTSGYGAVTSSRTRPTSCPCTVRTSTHHSPAGSAPRSAFHEYVRKPPGRPPRMAVSRTWPMIRRSFRHT